MERSAGPGRPRRWCGAGCKQAARLEIRRLDRQLADVEDEARRIRVSWSGSRPAAGERLQKLDAERRQLEQRLRDLLDDDEPEER